MLRRRTPPTRGNQVSAFGWLVWFLTAMAFIRQRSRRIEAEARAAESEDRTAQFGVMFAEILNRNPETIQAYFDALIEEDQHEEEQ